MITHHAHAAKKALSLKKDAVFRLLFVMVVLLGWVMCVGVSVFLGLENMYSAWQLEQKSRISLYLLADTPADKIAALKRELEGMRGVDAVYRLPEQDVFGFLQPYFSKERNLPLPIVLDADVTSKLDRALLERRVTHHIPGAHIDDARSVLSKISQGVRVSQVFVLGVASIVLVIVALLVSLTVRAGLRGLRQSLVILQFVGATDSFLTDLVTRQVLRVSLLGWFFACILGGGSLFLALYVWPESAVYIAPEVAPNVWVGLMCAPLVLVFICMAASWLTARTEVRKECVAGGAV